MLFLDLAIGYRKLREVNDVHWIEIGCENTLGFDLQYFHLQEHIPGEVEYANDGNNILGQIGLHAFLSNSHEHPKKVYISSDFRGSQSLIKHVDLRLYRVRYLK